MATDHEQNTDSAHLSTEKIEQIQEQTHQEPSFFGGCPLCHDFSNVASVATCFDFHDLGTSSNKCGTCMVLLRIVQAKVDNCDSYQQELSFELCHSVESIVYVNESLIFLIYLGGECLHRLELYMDASKSIV